MGKGGFPVGTVVLPLLVLAWPGDVEPARQVVAFMLPMLCSMDVVAVYFYRSHIQWRRIAHLAPGSLLGVAIGSILFVSETSALISVSDRYLKLLIGIVGILFLAYRTTQDWLLKRLPQRRDPRPLTSAGFGMAAGLTSTLAHAAGPVTQVFFLMQRPEKMTLAANLAGFFFALNLIKLIPFIALGRLNGEILTLAGSMLPIVPVGVGAGYLLVRSMKGSWYIAFIHLVLLVTSVTLIWNALAAG